MPVTSMNDHATVPTPSTFRPSDIPVIFRDGGGGSMGPTKSFLSNERQMLAPESKMTGTLNSFPFAASIALNSCGDVMAALKAVLMST